MKDYGKKFEQDLADSVTSGGIFCHRIKTRKSQYKGDNEIADFILFKSPSLFVLELKSTQEKRLPFAMIRWNQVDGLEVADKVPHLYAGILVQFREPEYSHFYIPIGLIREYAEQGKKSIPIADCKSDKRIIEVNFWKKRVTVTLDVDTMIELIERGYQ